MPAQSKSQQRLFGMVHAYNKGEFHGSRSLRRRVAALSRRISDADARHFADTPHDGLPERKGQEKKAQVVVRPETLQEIYGRVPIGAYAGAVLPTVEYTDHSGRSRRRRTFLGHVLYGAGAGAAIGGIGSAGLGAFIVSRSARNSGIGGDEARRRVLEAAARCGMWGAGRGAAAGSAVGAGLGLIDKIRG